MRILIADDDVTSRSTLTVALRKCGHEVEVTCDGAQAWEAMQRPDAPRVAILDWMMPGMDGVDVCRRVRAVETDRPHYLIMLTSRDKKEDTVEGLSAGMNDYLAKPFDPGELRARVEVGCRMIEIQDQLADKVSELREALDQVRILQESVAKIQETLLLGQLPEGIQGLRIAKRTIPSQQMDGDFYDFVSHGSSCLDIMVGDIMGKGTTAALLAAATRNHFLRALTQLETSSQGLAPEPEAIVNFVHTEVTPQFTRPDIGLFVTLCYARFDLEQRQVTFVDCGHTKTIHYHRATDQYDLLEGTNMPLGVVEREVYEQVSRPFETGDIFFFYSDGITEARNTHGEFFGEERVAEVVISHCADTPEAIIDRVLQAATAFSGANRFDDDATCVAVVIGKPPPQRAVCEANLTILSDLDHLARARQFLRAFCKSRPGMFNEDDLYHLQLALFETLTNIAKHAYHSARGQSMRIGLLLYEDRLCVNVFYKGDFFDAGTLPDPDFETLAESGYGAYIIQQCVDEVRYERLTEGGNRVTLVKRFSHS